VRRPGRVGRTSTVAAHVAHERRRAVRLATSVPPTPPGHGSAYAAAPALASDVDGQVEVRGGESLQWWAGVTGGPLLAADRPVHLLDRRPGRPQPSARPGARARVSTHRGLRPLYPRPAACPGRGGADARRRDRQPARTVSGRDERPRRPDPVRGLAGV